MTTISAKPIFLFNNIPPLRKHSQLFQLTDTKRIPFLLV
jgi:hypothetical protein